MIYLWLKTIIEKYFKIRIDNPMNLRKLIVKT